MVEQRFYAMAKDFGGFLIKTSDVKGLMFLEDAIQPYFTFPDLRSAFSFAIKVLYNPGLSDTVSALGGTIGFGMSVVGGIAADDKQDYQIEYNGERVNLAHRAMTFAHKWHIWIVGEEGQVDEIKTIRVYIYMYICMCWDRTVHLSTHIIAILQSTFSSCLSSTGVTCFAMIHAHPHVCIQIDDKDSDGAIILQIRSRTRRQRAL